MDDDGALRTPFTQRLGTNYIPSHRELSQITAMLREPLQQLDALNSQVAALVATQTKLKAAVDDHLALCHPIRRFPNELLVEVFAYCLPTTHLPVLNALEAPMLLTHVCRLWRSLSLSIPNFWTSLHIPVPYGMKRDNPEFDVTVPRLECVEWWLSHCKKAPLDQLSFYFSREAAFMVSDNQLKLTLGTITRHSHHIRELILDLHDHVLTQFSNLPPESFPLLEKMVVYGWGWTEVTARGQGIGSGSVWKAPNLTKIVWDGVGDVFLRLPLYWQQMREIQVVPRGIVEPANYLTHIEARALIEATPNITDLKITMEPEHDIGYLDLPDDWRIFTFSTGVDLSKVYTLSHLTTLDIFDCIYTEPDDEKSDGITFLSNLLLPALTTLKYDFAFNPDKKPKHHPLSTFLRLQADHHPILITKWKVSTTSMSQDTFFGCLMLMPNLQYLHLENPNSLINLRMQHEQDYADLPDLEVFPADNMLAAFLPSLPTDTYPRPVRYLCPNLESLRCDSSDFSISKLRWFVHGKTSRVGTTNASKEEGYVGYLPTLSSIAPLRRIHVGLMYPAPDGEDAAHLEDEFCQMGLEMAKVLFYQESDPLMYPLQRRNRSPLDGAERLGQPGFVDTEQWYAIRRPY